MPHMIKITGDDIPARLLEIPQPPRQLYLKGELPSFKEYTYLAVVGSRRLSHYGRDACESLIAGLAGYPLVIVSGLAIGMDTIAHRAALKAGLPTVGFPGSGLDPTVLYPASNRGLAEEIISAGGALVSESAPDERALPYKFPERNRLMVGVSDAVLVVEAGEKSGTLITARLATDYNRDLYVVPGSIFSPHCAASNRLIRQGAMPVCSAPDLLAELGFDVKEKQLALNLSSEEEHLMELIYEPKNRDELIRESGMEVGACNTLLVTMEIKGLIKETLGEIRLA
ncbi:MAG: DNA-protecting protein DprA [Candidatus Vogelbacteria bacterium CG10_big_fil_rev_8_21_14_0_10_51_16]|uniref:DNA-protecting protein DprA n=1 Tax=Candidatus Vogelbacteria bacterium CG10_big_fil_rev_8_21_14_0_10_51_16 TaxID=1975045 RepID=A0A2H0RDW3_9BACT|nr:MAG: DNA-protecting protein DprA [Candidatus Vogelbacteria bacterium CG10_big_fil_rev_8_21_14_0_10_51_16]